MTEYTAIEDSSAPPLSRQATVVRFSPASAEAMLGRAEKEYRRAGVYRISVFAADAMSGEDEEALVRRILEASTLQGISPESNLKYWYLAEAGQLYDLGYPLLKVNFEGEIAEHYGLGLGNRPTIEDTERIANLFQARRRDQ